MKPLFVFIFGVFCMAAQGQTKKWETNAAPLHRAEKALTDLMVYDIFSPPVASRVYVYSNVAAYEALVKDYPDRLASLYGQVESFPVIPEPSVKISSSLASVYAFLRVGRKLVFSEPALEDSIKNILQWYLDNHIDRDIYDASLRYGQQVADTILRWAEKDQYKETRKLRRYRFSKEEGKWIPTPPGYMAAVEPYWNRIRLFALDSSAQFRPPAAPAFSKDTGSLFYRQAHEVYEAGNKLQAEQKAIANFWDCNPFALNTEGHLNFAVKKISPGGHWISIAGLASKQQGLDIADAAAAYTITSIALFDSFISCWDEKYRSNVIRPETYINFYIDEGWRPLLQTPPFPEYTSGHSVISTAAAVVLSSFFGDAFSFADSTETEFGLPVRYFNSFMQAAEEAAISRFYGGIHYQAAILNGQREGRQIGEWVLNRIQLKK